MGPSGRAAVATGLWVLVTVGVAADPVVQAPRRCLLSHYRLLDPRVLEAVKALRDRYDEDTLSWRPRNCSFRLWRAPPRPASCARMRLVARGLAEAQAVLSGLRSPEPLPGTGPTLQLLAAAGRDVAACLELVQPGSSRRFFDHGGGATKRGELNRLSATKPPSSSTSCVCSRGTSNWWPILDLVSDLQHLGLGWKALYAIGCQARTHPIVSQWALEARDTLRYHWPTFEPWC